MNKVTIFAPATVGNIGPGFDVLGMALENEGDLITLEITDGPSQILEVRGKDASSVPLSPEKNIVVVSALAFLKQRGFSDLGVKVSIDRKLPIAGGLGSSAAASVGGALAAAWALHERQSPPGTVSQAFKGSPTTPQPFSDLEILEAALRGEEKVSGRHLDNIAPCFFGGITMIQSVSPPIIQKIPLADTYFVTVVSPDLRLSTKKAREVLPASLSTPEWTKQMSYAIGLAVGLTTGNDQLISDSLHDTFAEPARSHLIDRFSFVKQAALQAGALGCSISGAGPSVFALSKTSAQAEQIGMAMEKAFLPITGKVLISPIAKKGAYRL